MPRTITDRPAGSGVGGTFHLETGGKVRHDGAREAVAVGRGISGAFPVRVRGSIFLLDNNCSFDVKSGASWSDHCTQCIGPAYKFKLWLLFVKGAPYGDTSIAGFGVDAGRALRLSRGFVFRPERYERRAKALKLRPHDNRLLRWKNVCLGHGNLGTQRGESILPTRVLAEENIAAGNDA